MATLQKIRSKGPLLLIVIGLAMLAFILGDAWKIIRPNQGVQYVGTIDGKDIPAMDYRTEIDNYTEVMQFINQTRDFNEEQNSAIRDQAWADMVRDMIMDKEAKAIGLTVTDAEVKDVIERGTDPILQGTPFSDSEGKFDVDYLKQFLAVYSSIDRNSVPAEELQSYDMWYKYWLFIEKNIKSDLLYSKYSALVSASMLSNPISAKDAFEKRITRFDALMAYLPYSSLSDEEAKITTADLKKAYAENKELLYNYSETRDIVYIDSEILPSDADRENLLAEMNDITTQLEGEESDFAALVRRSSSEVSYSEVARSISNLPYDVVVRLDSVKVGGVFGPYYNETDDSYNAFKLLGKVQGYDSIQFSIMQVTGTDDAEIASRTDSIVKALKKGADFSEIAAKYSQTAVEQWLGADSYEPAAITGDNAIYLNKLNSMKKGEVASLNLSDASLVVKLFDVRTPVTKYNTVVIKRPVEFGQETSNDAYNKLSLFVAQNSTIDELKANAEDSDFRLLYYPGVQNYSYNIGGVAKSHEALRWLFDSKEGEVSRIFEVGNSNDHLLVVGVEKIHPRGYTSLADATQSLSYKVLKHKKAEILKGRLEGQSFDAITSMDGVEVDTVKYVNFTNAAYIASAYSNEPLLGASLMNLGLHEATLPIEGENGVFVAEKISPISQTAEFDEAAEKERLKVQDSRQILNSIISELYFQAKVIDNRYKIF